MNPKTLRRALREIVNDQSAHTCTWQKCVTYARDNIEAAVPDAKIRLGVSLSLESFSAWHSPLTIAVSAVEKEVFELTNEP